MSISDSIRKCRWARAAIGVLFTMGGLGAIAVPAFARQTQEEELATAQAAKATDLHPWAPSSAERRIEMITRLMVPRVGWYPFIGSIFPGLARRGTTDRIRGSGDLSRKDLGIRDGLRWPAIHHREYRDRSLDRSVTVLRGECDPITMLASVAPA